MRKPVLRWLLGAGYVVLVTSLLLYQIGLMGRMQYSVIAVLGTLLLGIALAVVLVLYIRVSDQIKRQEISVHNAQEKDSLPEKLPETGEQRATQVKDGGKEYERKFRSYEEIYAQFLAVMETCALSERELEVAWLLYRGYTNRQIGEEL